VLDHPHEHTIVLPKADSLQDSPGPADNVSIDLADIAPGTGVLVVRSGEREGERFVLRGELADIGRHPDSAICLEDVTVSRRHAEISHVEGAYRVVDRGSLNGTYINQERVEAGELLHGDELQIGKFRMVFFDGR
jgi:pSer/pThr/pTyr-binding forkhead associated (FHA) protein